MPIEIKELHIKVTVNASPTPAHTGTQVKTVATVDYSHADKDALVAECVEQVMQILQHKLER